MNSNKFLFYGPKGCGKSLFAECFFGELKIHRPEFVYVVLPNDVIVKDPIEQIEEKFYTIKSFNVPGILIESIDFLLSDLANNKAAVRLLFESIKSINDDQYLIATTRNPSMISSEFLYYFDDILPFYYFDVDGRLDILKIHSSKFREIKYETDVSLEKVARMTTWFSGAELEELVVNAQNSCDGDKVTFDAIFRTYNFIKNRINEDARVKEIINLLDFTDKYCEINSVKEGFRTAIKDLNKDILKNKGKFSLRFLNEIFELKPNFFGIGINLNGLISKLSLTKGNPKKAN